MANEAVLIMLLLAASLRSSAQFSKPWMKSKVSYEFDCESGGHLHKDLVESVAYLAGTLATNNLHVAFQGIPDGCLMHCLWSKGIPADFLQEYALWGILNGSSYQLPIQIILVGDLAWLSSVSSKAVKYYSSAKLNALKTHWLWVDTTNKKIPQAKKSTDINPTNLQGHQPVIAQSLPFVKAMETISRVIKEGVRGVLVSIGERDISFKRSNPSGARSLQRWVNIGSIEAPGDGSWQLKHSATWAEGVARIYRPLWPGVPFNLRGRAIRISCLKKPTVFDFDKSGARLKDSYGYAADLAREIQRRLNFTDVLVVNTGFGALANGTWNGMVGDLYRGLADVSPTDFTPIWQRTLVIDFGLVYGTDPVVIISKAPSVYIKTLLVLEIFTPFVWCCLVATGVLTGIVLGVLMKIRLSFGHYNGTIRRPSSYAGASLMILVNQSSSDNFWPTWIGGRIISGVMMFVSLICASLYSSSITAFLAIPFRSPAINSLGEMLDKKVVPAIRLLSSPYSFFLTENSGPVGEQVRKVMLTFSGTDVAGWDFMQKVADGTYSWIDTASSAIGSAGQFEQTGKACLYHVAHTPVRMDLDAFAYPKNSIVMYQFDEIMRWFRNYGIIEKMKRKYYSHACIAVAASNGPQIINITQIQGAFYVLGTGFILAWISLLLEWCLYFCVKRRFIANLMNCCRANYLLGYKA